MYYTILYIRYCDILDYNVLYDTVLYYQDTRATHTHTRINNLEDEQPKPYYTHTRTHTHTHTHTRAQNLASTLILNPSPKNKKTLRTRSERPMTRPVDAERSILKPMYRFT